MHALLVAPDAVRPPGAFDGLRTHLGHPPLPAVYFSTLPAGDTGGELLPAGAAKFTGKDEQEVRALPPHGKGGKIYRRCRAVVHVCPDPLRGTPPINAFPIQGNVFCEVTVSQERGFGSNHLVFLKARPQHAMGRCELRILGYTRYNTRNISSFTDRR